MSTLHIKDEVKDILANLGANTQVTKISESMPCGTITYMSPPEMVVKVYNCKVRTRERLVYESKLVDYAGKFFQVPKILRITETQSSNKKLIVVMKYVKGLQPFRGTRAIHDFPLTCVNSLARAMAKLHSNTVHFNPPSPRIGGVVDLPGDKIFGTELNLILDVYSNIPRKMKDEIFERVSSLINENLVEVMRRGGLHKQAVVHYDFIPRNIIYEQNGEVTGLIDFGFSSFGYVLCDVAWTLDYFGYPRPSLHNLGWEPRYSIMDSFLCEYLDRVPFIMSEIDLLQHVLPLVKVEYQLSLVNYYCLINEFSHAVREIDWMVDFLKFYHKNPYLR